MGRRRRKKYRKLVLLKPPRLLPTVFECPHCGAKALSVEIRRKERNEAGLVKAIIRCGSCGLYSELWVPELFQPVDVYSKFLDAYVEGKAEYTFTKRERVVAEPAGEEDIGESGGESEEEEGEW